MDVNWCQSSLLSYEFLSKFGELELLFHGSIEAGNRTESLGFTQGGKYNGVSLCIKVQRP